jgi:lipopolysaccharide transport system permease protein
MESLIKPFALLWNHRILLWQTTWNDIRARYAGSTLGWVWLLLYPLLFLGVYALVYIYVLKIRFALFDSNEYVILIFCGLIPFLGFAEALSGGVGSVTANAGLIKNTLFPIELIPVKAVLVSQASQVIGTGLLLGVLGFFGKLTLWALLLPLIWVTQLLFTIGLIWILSSLNVYMKDLQNMVAVLNLLLMLISPIAYTIDMVPPELRSFLGINPLYYMIVSYQDALMIGRFPRADVLWVLLALALLFFWVGHGFFRRMKGVFADRV